MALHAGGCVSGTSRYRTLVEALRRPVMAAQKLHRDHQFQYLHLEMKKPRPVDCGLNVRDDRPQRPDSSAVWFPDTPIAREEHPAGTLEKFKATLPA